MLDEIIRKRKKFENEIIKIGNFIIKNRKKIKILNRKKFQTNLDIIVDKKIKELIFQFFKTKKIISEENKIDRKKILVIDIDEQEVYIIFLMYQLCYFIKKPVYSLICYQQLKIFLQF